MRTEEHAVARPDTSGTEAAPSKVHDDAIAVLGLKPLRRRGRVALMFAVLWLAVVVSLAICADLLPLKEYGALGTEFKRPPGFRFDDPLGTDSLGRSQISRAIYGLRASLLLALGSTAIAMTLAVLFGTFAGYKRGWVERLFDLLTDSLLSFPPLLFLLAISAAMQPGYRSLLVSLSLLAFPTTAKVVRANTLSVANREFVLASRAMGATTSRVVLRELIPNVALPALSAGFLSIAGLIVAEGSLSFLGRGLPKPTPSLGGMIADGREHLRDHAHLVFVPGAILALTIFSLNVVGERLRARLSLRNVDS